MNLYLSMHSLEMVSIYVKKSDNSIYLFNCKKYHRKQV